MYRALIGTASSELFNASRNENLYRCLLRQLIHSPLTDSVTALSQSPDESILKDFGSNPKFRRIDGDVDSSVDLPSALFLLNGESELGSARNARLDHICLISSIFTKFPGAREEGFLDQLREKNPGARISVFRIGRVLAVEGEGRFDSEVLMDKAYEVGSQFLPAKYREISANHLAQAMRLNYETCTPDYKKGDGSENIELLSFVDCMKILGLEERI